MQGYVQPSIHLSPEASLPFILQEACTARLAGPARCCLAHQDHQLAIILAQLVLQLLGRVHLRTASNYTHFVALSDGGAFLDMQATA